METPHKLTRLEVKTQMEDYFRTACYQGPNQLWRHKCGTVLKVRSVSLSIHSTPPGAICGGSGGVEPLGIPYCSRCEPEPAETGCMHDPAELPIPLVIGPELSLAPPILVWRFEEAPEEYRKLSPHGGDEDWLALVPPSYQKTGVPEWMEACTPFAICQYSEHILPGGFLVAIGTHS